MMRLLIICSLFVLVAGCGKSKKSSTKYANALSGVSLTISVYYEEGAEPYAGGTAWGNLSLKYWDLLQRNLESLFLGRSRAPVIKVPKELSEMNKISKSNKATWTLQEALNLAKSLPSPSSSNFVVIFVNGRASENSNIIGFNITGENIIFIFKEVIAATGTPNLTGTPTSLAELVPQYVEQSTLIHEMGHALGLVNNGLTMQTPHQDTANGAHCSDENCVMYYANEGTASLIKFAQARLERFDLIMFDDKCLNDARSYKP